MPPSRADTRFATIDDAVALLKLLPPDVETIAWPVDEGDIQVVGDALSWLARWAPRANSAFKSYRRDARRVARDDAAG
jgi:hypothetical protein